MKFKFETMGKMIYGMPYVARIKLDIDNSLRKDFIEAKAHIDNNGDVKVVAEYEAENYEIIEERHGSCCPDELALYSLVYRNKLITLGEVSDKELVKNIELFLDKKLSIVELLSCIDELIKEQFENEINEILNSEKENILTDKMSYINIRTVLKEFVENNEYIILQFNDFHVIFESECEKIIMKFINDNNVYIECSNFKVNIMIDKIENYEAFNSKYDFSKINIFMKDGATISLIKSN